MNQQPKKQQRKKQQTKKPVAKIVEINEWKQKCEIATLGEIMPLHIKNSKDMYFVPFQLYRGISDVTYADHALEAKGDVVFYDDGQKKWGECGELGKGLYSTSDPYTALGYVGECNYKVLQTFIMGNPELTDNSQLYTKMRGIGIPKEILWCKKCYDKNIDVKETCLGKWDLEYDFMWNLEEGRLGQNDNNKGIPTDKVAQIKFTEKGIKDYKIPYECEHRKDLNCLKKTKKTSEDLVVEDIKQLGGKRRTKKSVRKHRGIHQSGGKKGKLKKGYKYSGKKLKNGKAEIIKIKIKRN